MPKCATGPSRGLAPGQHSSEKTSQRWPAVGNPSCPGWKPKSPGWKPKIYNAESDVLATTLTDWLRLKSAYSCKAHCSKLIFMQTGSSYNNIVYAQK